MTFETFLLIVLISSLTSFFVTKTGKARQRKTRHFSHLDNWREFIGTHKDCPCGCIQNLSQITQDNDGIKPDDK